MNKIPNIKLPEVYYENNFIKSELVEVTSDTGILVEMQYPKLGMECAIKECLVRKEVLEKLIEAKKYLPEDLTLKIWDAYRPLNLQKELYYKYKEQLIKTFNLEKLSEEEQNEVIRNYVSLPIENDILGPLHSTGGSVDVTLTRISDGKDLDFGIEFDSFSNLTNTSAFEEEGMDSNVRNNRRILFEAMTKAGFTNLPSECWHYDYGNRNWAYYNNKPAIYSCILSLKQIEKI